MMLGRFGWRDRTARRMLGRTGWVLATTGTSRWSTKHGEEDWSDARAMAPTPVVLARSWDGLLDFHGSGRAAARWSAACSRMTQRDSSLTTAEPFVIVEAPSAIVTNTAYKRDNPVCVGRSCRAPKQQATLLGVLSFNGLNQARSVRRSCRGLAGLRDWSFSAMRAASRSSKRTSSVWVSCWLGVAD